MWLLLQLRIWKLKRKVIFAINLLFCLIWASYLILWQNNMQNKTLNNEIEVNQMGVLLEPDDYTISGDLLKFTGKSLSKKQRILVYYRFKTEEEKKQFAKIQTAAFVQISGKMNGIRGPTNENEFDFRQYMAGKNVFNQLQAKQIKAFTKFQRNTIFSFFHSLRKKIIDYLDMMPQPLGWFIQVLLIGYQSENFQDSMDQINKLGLLYLFTLSGMHVYYLISIVRYVTRKFWVTKETADLILLFLLPIYGIIGGGSLGLLRSLSMSWLHIFSSRCGSWKMSGIETWSFVLLLNLLITPMAVFSLGAQLSYLLTLILMFSQEKDQFLIGAKMGGFTLPLVLWHVFTWNIWTIPLSILIGPFFDWIIFPVVVIGFIFVPFRPICNAILVLVQHFFAWGASVPGTIIFGKPPLIFIFIWLGSMLWLEVSKKKKMKIFYILISYLLAFCWIHFPFESEVTYFDIGQGDCSLIKTKFNRDVFLIDTGGRLSFNTQKWQVRNSRTNGETVVVNYLHSKGISRIDRLYLTHQDTDHVGNFPSISQNIKIKRLYLPAGMEKLASFQNRLRNSKIKPQVVTPVTDQTSEFPIQILHPFESGAGKNEDSMVLLYRMSGQHFLFTGDLDQVNELKVIQKYPTLTADVMKTGHHGSKTSSAPTFIEHLNPKLAIISAGRNNRYGHPNAETLATLKKNKVPFVITAQSGMIKLKADRRKKLKIETFDQTDIKEKKEKNEGSTDH